MQNALPYACTPASFVKRLYKIVLLVAGLLVPALGYSQVHLGLKAGTNLTYLVVNPDYGFYQQHNMELSLGNGIGPGFYAGATVKIPLTNEFTVNPGLQLTQRGFGYSTEAYGNGFTQYRKQSYRINYLELPLRFGWQKQLQTYTLLFHAGPYVSSGLFGIYRYQISSEQSNQLMRGEGMGTVQFTNQYGSDNMVMPLGAFRRLEYGLDLGIGMGYKNWELNLQYRNGLNNVKPSHDFATVNTAWERGRFMVLELGLTYYVAHFSR